MDIYTFLFIVFLIFCLYQVAAIIANRRIISYYRQIRLKAETQRAFGIVRQDLFRLVAEGKMSPESFTFGKLYFLATRVMRSPDQYNEIAKLVADALVCDPKREHRNGVSRLMAERLSWPEEMKSILLKTDHALTQLVIYHSPLYRSLLFIFRYAAKLFRVQKSNEARKRIRERVITEPETKTIFEAKDSLKEMAAYT